MQITCFAHGYNYEQIILKCSTEDKKLSPETVADRFNYCREVCMIALDDCYVNEEKIDRKRTTVKINECKIRRRKFKRRTVVEALWVLGMIVRGKSENFRIKICPNNKCDQETLIKLIKNISSQEQRYIQICGRVILI